MLIKGGNILGNVHKRTRIILRHYHQRLWIPTQFHPRSIPFLIFERYIRSLQTYIAGIFPHMHNTLILTWNIPALSLDQRRCAVSDQNKTCVDVRLAIASKSCTRPVKVNSVFVVVGAGGATGDKHICDKTYVLVQVPFYHYLATCFP